MFPDPTQILSNYPVFRIKRSRLSSIIHGSPLGIDAFENPDEVWEWISHVVKEPLKKRNLFIGSYIDDVTQKPKIACVLSPVRDQDKSYKIKYEKVLIQEE